MCLIPVVIKPSLNGLTDRVYQTPGVLLREPSEGCDFSGKMSSGSLGHLIPEQRYIHGL